MLCHAEILPLNGFSQATGEVIKEIWDNYTQAQENEVRDNEIQMEGTRQWVDMIYKEDASAWSPEMREGLHQAFDITANFPCLGGICDWLNAELYEAEGDNAKSMLYKGMTVLPGILEGGAYLAKLGINGYKAMKTADLLELALKSNVLDELTEGVVKYSDETVEAVETVTKEITEEAVERVEKETAEEIFEETAEKAGKEVIEGGTPTVQKVFTDNPFDEAGNLKPNIKYQTGEYKYNYETDANGRISNWNTDNLQLTERESRLNYNSDTPGKIEGDHAGHLAGDRFGGSPELDNIVSQSQNVNLSQYK